MNEDALIAAKSPAQARDLGIRRFYLGSREYRPCACGVWVGSSGDDDVARVIADHNASSHHLAWRDRSGAQ